MDIKDIKNIRELAKLMGSSDISEISIEDGDAKLTLRREKEVVTTSAVIAAPVAAPAAPVAAAAPAAVTEAAAAEPASNLHFLTAPLVGTFYASSSPDSPPFAKVGDKVKKGQVLCIIEAMKLMNEIECDVDGTIEEVCLNNAEPVDYGAKIFGIKL